MRLQVLIMIYCIFGSAQVILIITNIIGIGIIGILKFVNKILTNNTPTVLHPITQCCAYALDLATTFYFWLLHNQILAYKCTVVR